MQKRLGVALDIGTTTIQGGLIDLKTKKGLSYFSSLNEQTLHGHDVITRLKFCLENPGGLEKLHKNVISSINFVIENLVSIAGENKESVAHIAAVGNAALYHFTLFLSPAKMAKPPYEPEYKDLTSRRVGDLGIKVNKTCEFNFLPNIGGFIGSDAIAVILCAGIDKSEEPILAIDIGTNGEITLGSRKKILTASTAAGPAFESWHISCGMRAVSGAIESVEDNEGILALKVMGGGEPKGLSGSGLIDMIAILLKRGHIDRSGRMKKDFVVYDDRTKIIISQDDVRQVQLAKAAFASGIQSLRRAFNGEISKFFITGSFGRCLNKESAKIIGIIPRDIGSEKVVFLENGALKGAEMFIYDKRSALSRIEDIMRKTEHTPLGQNDNFKRGFAEAIKF